MGDRHGLGSGCRGSFIRIALLDNCAFKLCARHTVLAGVKDGQGSPDLPADLYNQDGAEKNFNCLNQTFKFL